MSDRAIDGNFQALVVDEQRARELKALSEQLSEGYQGSSPTRRMAAYHSDTDLVARSQACLELMKLVDGVANTDSNVLLMGESGTELVAAAIHQRSRADRPFVMVKCSADHDGLGLNEAGDGTLFLDGITQLSSMFQANLLRALQTNARVIAATDRDLDQEVAAGRFSSDLLHRLNAVTIVLPSLREHLPAGAHNYSPVPAATNGHSTAASHDDWVTLSTIEGRYVAQVLEHTRGNKQAAARLLAIDRKTLDRMIKRHHIDSEKVRRAYR